MKKQTRAERLELLRVENERNRAYLQGTIKGIWSFAWLKDGVYYVGTCGTTYKEAIKEIEAEIETINKTLADLEKPLDLGTMNGWQGKYPEVYHACTEANHELEEKALGTCYNEYYCPLCKIKWRVDSSD